MLLFDILPVISAIVTVVGLSLKAGRILQKLDNVIEDVKSLKTEVKDIDRRLTIMETRFEEHDKKHPVT
jgi:hypothetical protein